MIAGRPRPTLSTCHRQESSSSQPGHSELAADLIHSRANVYFGTNFTRACPPSGWPVLHTAIDLDPQFRRLYLAGAAMLVYNGQRIVPDMILAANGVLARGRQAFPFGLGNPFQLGFNLLYELPMDATPMTAHPRLAPARGRGSASDRPL